MLFFKKYIFSISMLLLSIAGCNSMEISHNNPIKLTGKIKPLHFFDKKPTNPFFGKNLIGFLSEKDCYYSNKILGGPIIKKNDLCVPVNVLIHNDANPGSFFDWTENQMPADMAKSICDNYWHLTHQQKNAKKLLKTIKKVHFPTLFLPIHIFFTGICKLILSDIFDAFVVCLTLDDQYYDYVFQQVSRINQTNPIIFIQMDKAYEQILRKQTSGNQIPMEEEDSLLEHINELLFEADNFFETTKQSTDNSQASPILSLNKSYSENQNPASPLIILNNSIVAYESNKYIYDNKNVIANKIRDRIFKKIATSQKITIPTLLYQRSIGNNKFDQHLTNWQSFQPLTDEEDI